MMGFRLVTAVLASVLTLAATACSTTDVLTPQVDVGNGQQTTQTVQNNRLPPANAGNGNYLRAPESTGQYPAAPSTGYSSPQNTLEAQAQALGAGSQQGQALRAPDQTLQPPAGQQQQMPAAGQPQVAALPPSGNGNTIRFLPIIGAPVQAVTPLSRQLGAEARAAGLTIKGASDASSDHMLKGYFSAFSDAGSVTVVYVWDVLDANGGRLHRIQGQESVSSRATDPWAAVPASVMQQIATKTMAEYTAWRQANPG